MRIILLGFFSILIFGCASSQFASQVPAEYYIDPDDYAETVAKNSEEARKYDGFDNVFVYNATLLNMEVQEAQLRMLANTYQWDGLKISEKRKEILSKTSSESQVFISFFTPKSSLNDLNKYNTVWKVYLDVNGSRYRGKVQKFNGKYEHIKGLYSFHTRWSKAYTVTFMVPTSVIEDAKSALLITGDLGADQVIFNK